jgi:hypothetical protein
VPNCVAQYIQKVSRRDQIGGVKTFDKSIVDRLKAGDGVAVLALFAQQADEARRGSQEGALPARPVERFP